MKRSISELLKRADDAPTKQEKIDVLRQIDSPAIRRIIELAYNPSYVWLLPKGKAPYKPSEFNDQEGRLYGEIRRLYLFLEGGNPNLTTVRREFLFIQLLESVDPADAELLCSIKDGKLPYKSLTKNLIKEAYPGLLPNEAGDGKK